MADRVNKTKIAAQTLANMITTSVATGASARFPQHSIEILAAKVAVDGYFNVLIEEATKLPDSKVLIEKIQHKRTSDSVEIIREALIEAMGLKPEFDNLIDELADAVESRNNGEDDSRFQQALHKLFDELSKIPTQLDVIINHTNRIPIMADHVEEILEKVRSPKQIPPQANAETHESYLKLQVQDLTSENRELHDKEGQKKWDELQAALSQRSWDKAFTLSEEMEKWLDDQGDKVSSDIKGQALLLLVDMTIIRDSGLPFETNGKTEGGWKVFRKAKAALGSNPSELNAQRALRIQSKLLFLDGNTEEASKLLAETNGPGTISMHLAFLMESKKWLEASNLADDQAEYDKRWADDAIIAHLKADQFDRAQSVIDWAKEQDQSIYQACSLAYIRRIYSEITGDGSSKTLLLINKDDNEKLNELQSMLDDIFHYALQNRPRSGIEAEALEMAILIGHVQRNKQACQDAANRLVDWTPICPEIGRGVLQGDIAPIDNLADRYLAEYSNTFMTEMIAVLLLIDIEDDELRAIKKLRSMLEIQENEKHREEICESLMIAGQYCDDNTITDLIDDIEKCLGEKHRIPSMLRAMLFAKQNDIPNAEAELANIEDETNCLWLQIAGGISFQNKDWHKAAYIFRKFGDLTGNADAYEKEALAWYNLEEVEQVIESLEIAHKLAPNNKRTIANLASAYYQRARYSDAKNHFSTLWLSEKHTNRLTLNYASCLALDGDTPCAIKTLTEFIDEIGDKVGQEAIIMLSQLLHSQGNPSKALDILLPNWDRFCNNHQYLMQVMVLGYACNREGEAQKASNLLINMLNLGTLPEGVLSHCNIDDIWGMQSNWQDKKKNIAKMYLNGQLPWLIASSWTHSSNHCYLSWLMRTQALEPSDHPEGLSEHSIYSTNSLTHASQDGQDGQEFLTRITASPIDVEIVADISALITLHRLGLLENLSSYFEKVFVPQFYKQYWLEDQIHIPHHQPRIIETRQTIIDAIDSQKIHITSKLDANTPILDEYEKSPKKDFRTLRILQIAQWMAKTGKLNREKLAFIESKENQPILIANEIADEAMQNGSLSVKLFTLQTVAEYGVLEEFCECFHLCIDRDQYQQIKREINGQKAVDEAGVWYRELIEYLNNDPTIEFVALKNTEAFDKSDGSDIQYGLSAVLLAQERNLSLLTDDRYCQQGRLNTQQACSSLAFGVDALLFRLNDDGLINSEQHADHMLQLIRWRYKFLLPTPSILLTAAKRYKQGLPGSQLRSIAVYMQDCMRDAGLYGGMEPVTPPVSMARSLFKAWVDIIADFIVQLWWDDEISQRQAALLTRWASQHLLPAYPKNGGATNWQKIADLRQYAFLGSILQHLLLQKDSKKANKVVNRIRRSMDTPKDVIDSVTETAIRSMMETQTDANQDQLRHFYIKILHSMHGNPLRLNWKCLALVKSLNILDINTTADKVSADYVDAVADFNHELRLKPKPGPFIYTRKNYDTNAASATFLPELLCTENLALRNAAIDHLASDEYIQLSKHTRKAISAVKKNIQSESLFVWMDAVSSILESVEHDFSLNISGLSQSLEFNHDEGSTKCWTNIIKPTIESLLAIDSDGWLLLPHRDDSTSNLIELLQSTSSITDLLNTYDRLVGHLTLSPPLDLGSQLLAWTESHGETESVWPTLKAWAYDKLKPWRCYHACQAILRNIDWIPADQTQEFWDKVSSIVEMCLRSNLDSDDTQVWQLESELAEHYLHMIDLSGFGLHQDRPITIAWWAARHVTETITNMAPNNDLPSQIRFWRNNSIHPRAEITDYGWTWLIQDTYSPSRFATLQLNSPRSIALLIAIGEFAKEHGIDLIPKEHQLRILNCLAVPLLTADAKQVSNESTTWMWDHSFFDAAVNFTSALPNDEQTKEALSVISFIKGHRDVESLSKLLDQLPNANEIESVFTCSRIRQYCYENTDIDDKILSLLRDADWRDACAAKLSLKSWDQLTRCLMFIQGRQELDWIVEVPYIFLKLAEVTPNDADRSKFFIAGIVASSLTGGTLGALKALGKSNEFAALRPSFDEVKSSIVRIHNASTPDISIRFQDILTLLDAM